MTKESKENDVLKDNNGFIYNHANEEKALFVFAHGAGADMQHEFIEQFSQLLVKEHISVLRFNFPYMVKRQEDGKRRPPDRMPKLLACFAEVLANIGSTQGDLPLFIGGKSMGGRVAATLTSIDEPQNTLNKLIKGVICLGYPFHPQKKPEKLRLEPLQNAQKPVLIIQGDRDALGSAQEISEYSFSALCQVHFLTDGDHNLKPRVKSGFNHQQHLETAAAQIKGFIDENS